MVRMICALVGLLIFSNQSFAGFVYSLALDQAIYNVAPNTTFTSNVFLVETATAPDTSATSTLAGSISIGYNFTRTAGLGAVTGATTNGAFNLSGPPIAIANGFNVQNTAIFTVAPQAPAFSGTQRRIAAGTVTISSGASGQTLFAFSDNDNVLTNTQIFNPNNVGLDASVFANSGVVQVNVIAAIPEPSSMALLGMVGVGAGIARRFRRKRST